MTFSDSGRVRSRLERRPSKNARLILQWALPHFGVKPSSSTLRTGR